MNLQTLLVSCLLSCATQAATCDVPTGVVLDFQPLACPPGDVSVTLRRGEDNAPHPRLCLAPAQTHVLCEHGCYVFYLEVGNKCPLSLGLKDGYNPIMWAEPFSGKINVMAITTGLTTLTIGQCRRSSNTHD